MYPDVSLEEAREKAEEARKMVKDGVRPSGTKKRHVQPVKDNKFEVLAWEWFETRKAQWGAKHTKDTVSKLNLHILPRFGHLPVADITRDLGLSLCDALKNAKTYGRGWGQDEEKQTGKMQSLDKILTILKAIFKFASDRGIPNITDWTGNMRALYVFPDPVAMPALLTPAEIKQFLQKLNEFRKMGKMGTVTFLAIRFLILVFCRPGQVREAEWKNVDFINRRWDQPSKEIQGRPKGRPAVMLADQTLTLLDELKILTGHSDYLFPQSRNPALPMSENALNEAFKRMGYKGKVVAHGFRSTARTLLSENGFEFAWMEKQLGHGLAKNNLVARYDRGGNLEQRRGMMQWWADAVDSMEKGEPLPNSKPYR